MSDIRNYMNIVEGTGMRDYVERVNAERTSEIMANGGIAVGDFVNLSAWFRDIWAEVIGVYVSRDNPKYNSVTYVIYSKDGKERDTDQTSFGEIRAVKKPDEAAGFKDGTYHTKGGKFGL